VPREIVQTDIWIMLAATVMLLFFAISGWRISRIEGGVLLAAYGVYLAFVTLS
jgi:cation:H+ antiporter